MMHPDFCISCIFKFTSTSAYKNIWSLVGQEGSPNDLVASGRVLEWYAEVSIWSVRVPKWSSTVPNDLIVSPNDLTRSPNGLVGLPRGLV